jgi:hypothetical protein
MIQPERGALLAKVLLVARRFNSSVWFDSKLSSAKMPRASLTFRSLGAS